MDNIARRGNDGLLYLVPKDTPEDQIMEGVPLNVDLSFLNFPVQLEQTLRIELQKRGFVYPADFEKPGAYKHMADALREMFKVTANQVVDQIRRGST